MLQNYIKLSVRLLIRSPFFTFINISGLSVGFAVFFILWQHSTYELQSDRFHKDHGRIYRLYCDFFFPEGENWDHYIFSTLPPILVRLLSENNKDVESLTRIIHQKNFDAIRWHGPQTDTAGWSDFGTEINLSYIDPRHEKHSFKETRCAFADPNFFEFFSIDLIEGQPGQVLSQADAAVISQTAAFKYFGDQDPIGKVIMLNEHRSFTVTGVFKIGRNTHLNMDVLFSTLHIANAMESVDPFQETAVSYFKLRKGADISALEKAAADETGLHWNFQDAFPGSTYTFHLQPLAEAAFQIFENDSYSPKSKLKLQIFLVVGIVVLAMAWINYVNLQLSTQSARMKELATRKAAGARKMDFVIQFLVESLIVNMLAVLVAVTLIQLLKSPLELLFQLYVPDWNELKVETILIFLLAMLIGILVAALHPAFVTWRLTIRSMLNFGKVFAEGKNFTTITSVLQFVIAVVLIVWLGAVVSQVNLVLSNSWGLSRDGVVVVELPVNDSIIGRSNEVEQLKNELLGTAGVEDVTISRTVAGDLIRNRIGFRSLDERNLYVVPKSDGGVDERFIPFYKLEILAGRNFRPDNPGDQRNVVVSREAARCMGWTPEEAIGKSVLVEKHPWRPFATTAEVIGVIEDHKYSPLYKQSTLASANRGTLLTYRNHLFPKNYPARMSLRLKHGSDQMIEAIKTRYERIFPGKLFHWYFLDSHMNVHYQSEEIARNQMSLFTSIAIGIACLGLLGVISNKAVSRTKEIGIRKVLGARLHQIAKILLSPTLRQVGFAVLIATPLAYALTDSYLQKFSEQIVLQWWHFALPVIILLAIMLSSVAAVVWKAARRNPVEALKCE
ncbi:MAG TPA: ABC transporter permease [Chryseolinea sp.]|nr:ABC transporter permease [Chryseolinea sp.]